MEIERILERKKRGGRVCERENIWKKVKKRGETR